MKSTPRPILVCVLAALCALLPAHAQVLETGEIRDLHFGEALFHFYLDDHVAAITRLLVAAETGRIEHHAHEAALLTGGLYLHYGLHSRAEQIFLALLDESIDAGLRDSVWFHLGRARYRQGLHASALDALTRVEGRLGGQEAAELPMLIAQSRMALGQFDAAAVLLEQWQGPPEWRAFTRYNLGVALVRSGGEEEGIRQLELIGSEPAVDEEARALRDRANLAIGYARLQAEIPEAALGVLERVRLDGASANRALLGVGWARAAMADPAGALVPWEALRSRDRLDSAVQESMLAVPYALARLDADSAAAHAYELALDAFAEEIERIDGAASFVESGGLVPALLETDTAGGARWQWQLTTVPDLRETRYLRVLIASHDFQEGLRNYRDLAVLASHLEDWQGRLASFDDMVETRRQADAARAPEVGARLSRIDPGALEARHQALARRLAEVEATRDVAALASEAEQEHWQILGELGSGPVLAAASDEDRTRYRVLRGHLLWEMERDYTYRLWQQQRRLGGMQGDLEEVRARLARVTEERVQRPKALLEFAARIDSLSPRIDILLARVDALRTRQDRALRQLALEALGEQRKRLSAYQVQARFALATLYDRATANADVPRTTEPES